MSDTHLGPVDYFIIEFPNGDIAPNGFSALLDLVDRGSVYIIDIEFVRRDPDAALTTVPSGDLGVIDGVDLADFGGAATELLDADDLAFVGERIAAGSIAAVVVYEELSIAAVLDEFAAGGGRVVASGPVDLGELDAALGTENPAVAQEESK